MPGTEAADSCEPPVSKCHSGPNLPTPVTVFGAAQALGGVPVRRKPGLSGNLDLLGRPSGPGRCGLHAGSGLGGLGEEQPKVSAPNQAEAAAFGL